MSSYREVSVGKRAVEVRNGASRCRGGLAARWGAISGLQQITPGSCPGVAAWHANDLKTMFIGKGPKDV